MTHHNEDEVSLKEFILDKLGEYDKALEVAYASMDKRLDAMNEFRQSLKDQSFTFLPRTEFQGQHEAIVKELKDLQLAKALAEGKASVASVYFAYGLSIVGILIGVIEFIFRGGK